MNYERRSPLRSNLRKAQLLMNDFEQPPQTKYLSVFIKVFLVSISGY